MSLDSGARRVSRGRVGAGYRLPPGDWGAIGTRSDRKRPRAMEEAWQEASVSI
jgi:hypothetical protein